MLRMSRLTKTYRTDHVETRALLDFSFEVGAGEFVAVTGPSGSGKTTFLNVAGLLESFDSGSYELDGRDVSSLSDDDLSLLRNAKIGFIFQSFNLLPDLNVYDNIDVPLRYRRMKSSERRERIDAVLTLVGLAGRRRLVSLVLVPFIWMAHPLGIIWLVGSAGCAARLWAVAEWWPRREPWLLFLDRVAARARHR